MKIHLKDCSESRQKERERERQTIPSNIVCLNIRNPNTINSSSIFSCVQNHKFSKFLYKHFIRSPSIKVHDDIKRQFIASHKDTNKHIERESVCGFTAPKKFSFKNEIFVLFPFSLHIFIFWIDPIPNFDTFLNCEASFVAPRDTAKIVGGQDANEGAYTYMVSIIYLLVKSNLNN